MSRCFEIIGKTIFILVILVCTLEILARFFPTGLKYNILSYSTIPEYLPDNWSKDKYLRLREDLMNTEAANDDFLGHYFKPYKSLTVNLLDDHGITKRLTWNHPSSCFKENNRILEVYFFGGSTMFGHGVSDFETIPSYVSKILYNKYNICASVINFGRMGYVSTEEFLIFSYIAPKKRSNNSSIAVFLSGLNEIVSVNFFAPHNPEKRMGNSIIARIKRQSSSLLHNSRLIRVLGSYFANKNILTSISLSYQEEKEVEDNYKRNVVNILSIAKDNNFIPLFYWQPLNSLKKNKSAYEKNTKYVPEIIYRKEMIIPYKYFYDISNFFESIKKPIFLDFGHYNPAGNELIADRIATDIKTIIEREKIHITN